MRFTVAALQERGVAKERIFVSMERSMKLRDRALRALPARPELFICKDGPVFPLDARRAAAAGAGALTRRAEPADARGLEVRLLRRLPAQPARPARTSCWRSPASSRSPTSSRPRRATRRGPLRPLARRGLGHDGGGRRAHPDGAAQSRRLVTIGACATSGGIQALRNFADVEDFIVGRLRVARVRVDARHLHRRSPTTCTSTSSCRAARSTSASCSR